MVPGAQDVWDVQVDRLECSVRDLPLVVVISLRDIAHVCHQRDVPLLPVVFDPFVLTEKAGALIADVRPVLLGLPMARVGVALGVGQDD